MTTANGFGTISAPDHGRCTVTFERLLAAAPEATWAALTDPDQLAQWLAPGTFEAGVGGAVELRFDETDPDQRCVGRVLTWEPPTVLEYEWHFTGEQDSVLRFELTPTATGGTHLLLVHRLLGSAHAGGYGPGWHAHLDRLAAHLTGDALPEWDDRFAAVRAEYAVP